MRIKVNHFFFIANSLIEIDQITKTESSIMDSMQMLCIAIQFSPACSCISQLFFIFGPVRRMLYGKRFFELCKHLSFICLI